jgi:hypothetical protein
MPDLNPRKLKIMKKPTSKLPAKTHQSSGGLARAFELTKSTEVQDGEYDCRLISIELLDFDERRGQSVRALFKLEDGQEIEQWSRLVDKDGNEVRGGIIWTKLLLDKFGLEIDAEEGEGDVESDLIEAFTQINADQPRLRIEVSHKNVYQNVRVRELLEEEEEE